MSLECCAGHVGAESCTAPASVSKVLQAVKLDPASPMRRSDLAFKKLSESHDCSVYAGKRWTPVERREHMAPPERKQSIRCCATAGVGQPAAI